MHYFTEATPDHLPLIRKLALRIWPNAYRDILTHEQIQNMLATIYTEENLNAEMASGHRFFLIYDENVPSGFISAYTDADTIWIKKLYIDTGMQNKGLGTALINAALAELSPAARINLLVNPNNAPAQKYYEHKGFTKIGEKPVQMGDFHFTDFIYSRPINGPING